MRALSTSIAEGVSARKALLRDSPLDRVFDRRVLFGTAERPVFLVGSTLSPSVSVGALSVYARTLS